MSSCNERNYDNMEIEFLNNIPINNIMDVKSIKNSEYSLSQLNAYFGEYSLQELSVFDVENNKEELEMKKVNAKFPIQFLRNNKGCYYSVYKVKEGGYYYVFWSIRDDKSLFVSDTFHIDNLKEKSDFNSIEIGSSTYDDVYSIDPSSELILILSNGVYSYSLLVNGELLEIEYNYVDIKNRKDLIVQNINTVSKDSPIPTFLQYIFSEDLP